MSMLLSLGKLLTKCIELLFLEMLAVILCLKLWGNHFRGKKIRMFCDNLPICVLINNENSSSESLQDCLREVAFLAARDEFQIRMVHLSSEDSRISDHLSRWNLDTSYKDRFLELVRDYDLTEFQVSDNLFDMIHTWKYFIFRNTTEGFES